MVIQCHGTEKCNDLVVPYNYDIIDLSLAALDKMRAEIAMNCVAGGAGRGSRWSG